MASRPVRAASLRDQLAAFGPYFAVDRPDSSDDASWRPLSVLLDSPAALTERVLAVRAALGGERVEVRTAVSVAQLGLVARLISPMIGVAVLSGPAAAAGSGAGVVAAGARRPDAAGGR